MAETPIDSSRDLIELRLYRLSPLGPIATTLVIGLVVYGFFLLNIWITTDFMTFIADAEGQVMLRLAMILTLILCAALCVNYFDDRASRQEGEDVVAFLGRAPSLRRAGSKTLVYASIGGLVIGLVFLWLLILINADGNAVAFATSIGAWFIPMTPILFVLMARGVTGSIMSGSDLSRLIRDELKVDLYRHHELALFGRMAMRGAFVWLIFVGLVLLFFADNAMSIYAIPTLAVSVGIAGFNFLSAMQPIRRKIVAAKEKELTIIRERLAQARANLGSGDTSDIPALIALEERIEKVREWPLDLPTAARLPFYLLIPVVPWIGAAYAETMLGNLLGGG